MTGDPIPQDRVTVASDNPPRSYNRSPDGLPRVPGSYDRPMTASGENPRTELKETLRQLDQIQAGSEGITDDGRDRRFRRHPQPLIHIGDGLDGSADHHRHGPGRRLHRTLTSLFIGEQSEEIERRQEELVRRIDHVSERIESLDHG